MRGMHSKESAQKIIEAMRVYYNTCREHSRLKVTPMEAAGLKIDLGQNKIESLIRLHQCAELTSSQGRGYSINNS